MVPTWTQMWGTAASALGVNIKDVRFGQAAVHIGQCTNRSKQLLDLYMQGHRSNTMRTKVGARHMHTNAHTLHCPLLC